MTENQQKTAMTEALTDCLREASAQARHDQWQALTANNAPEAIIDALAERFAAQQEALNRKQALAEERQTMLNACLSRELPEDEENAVDPVAQLQENVEFLTRQLQGYESQFVRLQQQVRDAQEQLAITTADRDEAVAMKAELMERLSQASLRSAQLATEAGKLEKLFWVRLYNRLHGKK